jgi:hypothetical protein
MRKSCGVLTKKETPPKRDLSVPQVGTRRLINATIACGCARGSTQYRDRQEHNRSICVANASGEDQWMNHRQR